MTKADVREMQERLREFFEEAENVRDCYILAVEAQSSFNDLASSLLEELDEE